MELLVKEAGSAHPDKGWLKVSAEGLMSAAKAVSELAQPITALIVNIQQKLGF